MNARQALNGAVLRICNRDIRFVGQWSPLWVLRHSAGPIADELGLDVQELTACRDIEEITALIEKSVVFQTEQVLESALLLI